MNQQTMNFVERSAESETLYVSKTRTINMTIKPFAAKKQQPQQTDFKIHKSVTRRFRMLGYRFIH
jgi:hypothetical protein